MSEDWRISLDPKYEVSSHGRVRRLAPYRSTKVGLILTPLKNKDGHLQVRLSGKLVYVHRLVALAFIGLPPTKSHMVAHYDGDPSNNAVANLRWATAKENVADRKRHGTDAGEDRNPNSRLTKDDVLIIRSHLMYGERQSVLARLFGVTDSHMSAIASRKVWSQLEF